MNGYFLKGFADELNRGGGLMGDDRNKLARERFEYNKQRDIKADAIAENARKSKQIIDGLMQKKYLQDIATGEGANEDRQGAENFYRTVLRPEYTDSWQDKHMEGKGLAELGLMANTLAANEQSKYLGGGGVFKMPVDPTILTTRARVDDNKAARLHKVTNKGGSLTGDIKEYYDLTGKMPTSWDDIKQMKTASRPDPQPTLSERENVRLRAAVDKLSVQAQKDPNKFFENNNFRMNNDGSLYLDPVTAAPIRLDSFYKGTGKRGNIKAMMALGEQWDDAKELSGLLELPDVQQNLKQADDAGIWDRARGKWGNTVNKWMQNSGIAKNSNTATAIARIQRMASDERKRFMGTAVTDSEITSALAWMPNAGDSFDTMVNKTNLMGQEAEQAFRRWISTFEKDVDMSPFYKAFGIKRFAEDETNINPKATIISPKTGINWGN